MPGPQVVTTRLNLSTQQFNEKARNYNAEMMHQADSYNFPKEASRTTFERAKNPYFENLNKKLKGYFEEFKKRPAEKYLTPDELLKKYYTDKAEDILKHRSEELEKEYPKSSKPLSHFSVLHDLNEFEKHFEENTKRGNRKLLPGVLQHLFDKNFKLWERPPAKSIYRSMFSPRGMLGAASPFFTQIVGPSTGHEELVDEFNKIRNDLAEREKNGEIINNEEYFNELSNTPFFSKIETPFNQRYRALKTALFRKRNPDLNIPDELIHNMNSMEKEELFNDLLFNDKSEYHKDIKAFEKLREEAARFPGAQEQLERFMWHKHHPNLPFETARELQLLIKPGDRNKVFMQDYLADGPKSARSPAGLGELLSSESRALKALAVYELMNKEDKDIENIIPERLGEEGRRVNPFVYQGERIAPMSADTLEARKLAREVGKAFPGVGAEKEKRLQEMEKAYLDSKNTMNNIKTDYNNANQYIQSMDSEWPTIGAVNENIEPGESSYFKKAKELHERETERDLAKINENFKKEFLPSLRLSRGLKGQSLSSSGLSYEQKMIDKLNKTIAEERGRREIEALKHAYQQEGIYHDMVRQRRLDAEKRKEYLQGHSIKNAEARIALEKEALKVDQDRIKAQQEAAHQPHLAKLQQSHLLSQLGHQEETREQAKINEGVKRNEEEYKVPFLMSTAAQQANAGLPVQNSTIQIPMSGQNLPPNPFVAAQEFLANTSNLFNPAIPQQQSAVQPKRFGGEIEYKRGGRVHTHRLRDAYEAHLKRQEEAMERYAQKTRNWSPEWESMAAKAAAWSRAGSRDISIGEANAKALEAGSDARRRAFEEDERRENNALNLLNKLGEGRSDLFKNVEAQEHHDQEHVRQLAHDAMVQRHYENQDARAIERDKLLSFKSQKGLIPEIDAEGNILGWKKEVKPFTKEQKSDIEKINNAYKIIGYASAAGAASRFLPGRNLLKYTPDIIASTLSGPGDAQAKLDLFKSDAKNMALLSNATYNAHTAQGQRQVEATKIDPLNSPEANLGIGKTQAINASSEAFSAAESLRRSGIDQEIIDGIIEKAKHSGLKIRNQRAMDYLSLKGWSEEDAQIYQRDADDIWNMGDHNEKELMEDEKQIENKDNTTEQLINEAIRKIMEDRHASSFMGPQPGMFSDDLQAFDKIRNPNRMDDQYDNVKGYLRGGEVEHNRSKTKKEKRDSDPYRYANKAADFAIGALELIPFGRGISLAGKALKHSDKLIKIAPKIAKKVGHGLDWVGHNLLGGKAATNLFGKKSAKRLLEGNLKPAASMAGYGAAAGIGSRALQDVGLNETPADIIGGVGGSLLAGAAMQGGRRLLNNSLPTLGQYWEGHTNPTREHLKKYIGRNLGKKSGRYADIIESHTDEIPGYKSTLDEILTPSGEADVALLVKQRGENAPSIMNQKNENSLAVDKYLKEMSDATSDNSLTRELANVYENKANTIREALNENLPSDALSFHDAYGEARKGLIETNKQNWGARSKIAQEEYKNAINDKSPDVALKNFMQEYLSLANSGYPSDALKSIMTHAHELGIENNPLGSALKWKELPASSRKAIETDWANKNLHEKMEHFKNVDAVNIPALKAHSVLKSINKQAGHLTHGDNASLLSSLNKLSNALSADLSESVPALRKANQIYKDNSTHINLVHGTKDLDRALNQNKHFEYDVSAGAFGNSIMKGKDAFETAIKLRKVLGTDNDSYKSIVEHHTKNLLEYAMTPDGLLDPKKLHTWQKQHPGFEGLAPDINSRFTQIARQQQDLMDIPGVVKNKSTHAQSFSEKENFLDALQNAKNPSEFAEGVLRSIPESAREKGKNDMKSLIVNDMIDQLTGGGKKHITPENFSKYIDKHGNLLNEFLDAESLEKIGALRKVMTQRSEVKHKKATGEAVSKFAQEFEKDYLAESTLDNLGRRVTGFVASRTPALKNLYSERVALAKPTRDQIKKDEFNKLITDREYALKIFRDVEKSQKYYQHNKKKNIDRVNPLAQSTIENILDYGND